MSLFRIVPHLAKVNRGRGIIRGRRTIDPLLFMSQEERRAFSVYIAPIDEDEEEETVESLSGYEMLYGVDYEELPKDYPHQVGIW